MLQNNKGVQSGLKMLRSKFVTSTNRGSAQIVPEITQTILVCFQRKLKIELRCSVQEPFHGSSGRGIRIYFASKSVKTVCSQASDILKVNNSPFDTAKASASKLKL